MQKLKNNEARPKFTGSYNVAIMMFFVAFLQFCIFRLACNRVEKICFSGLKNGH